MRLASQLFHCLLALISCVRAYVHYVFLYSWNRCTENFGASYKYGEYRLGVGHVVVRMMGHNHHDNLENSVAVPCIVTASA